MQPATPELAAARQRQRDAKQAQAQLEKEIQERQETLKQLARDAIEAAIAEKDLVTQERIAARERLLHQPMNEEKAILAARDLLALFEPNSQLEPAAVWAEIDRIRCICHTMDVPPQSRELVAAMEATVGECDRFEIERERGRVVDDGREGTSPIHAQSYRTIRFAEDVRRCLRREPAPKVVPLAQLVHANASTQTLAKQLGMQGCLDTLAFFFRRLCEQPGGLSERRSLAVQIAGALSLDDLYTIRSHRISTGQPDRLVPGTRDTGGVKRPGRGLSAKVPVPSELLPFNERPEFNAPPQ